MKKFSRKNNLRRKKALKGMTLMEIIIAMVVLVIISTLIAEAGVGAVNNVRASKSVIEKVNYQSRYVTGSYKKYQGLETDGTEVEKDMNKTPLTFQLQDTAGANLGNSISVDIYEAPGMAEAADYKNGTFKRPDGTAYDRAGNLKYFE